MNAILPDVSLSETATLPAALHWVGMQGIDLPIRLGHADLGGLLPARADVQVDLPAATAKGIHMSRLYQLLDRLGRCSSAWKKPASRGLFHVQMLELDPQRSVSHGHRYERRGARGVSAELQSSAAVACQYKAVRQDSGRNRYSTELSATLSCGLRYRAE